LNATARSARSRGPEAAALTPLMPAGVPIIAASAVCLVEVRRSWPRPAGRRVGRGRDLGIEALGPAAATAITRRLLPEPRALLRFRRHAGV